MNEQKQIQTTKNYKYVLIALILILGAILLDEVKIFTSGFLGSITIYTMLRNQNKYLVEKKGWYSAYSSLLLLLEALFIFLIPIALVVLMAVNTISNFDLDFNAIHTWFYQFIDSIENRFNIEVFNQDNVTKIFSPETLSSLPKWGGNIIQFITSNSYSVAMNFLLILFLLYFMLYSYRDFESLIKDILPFSKENKKIFIKKTKLIIQANAIGIPLIAFIQGALSYCGYLFFGVPNPLLYAVFTSFATIIPMVGTSIVYIPISLYLLSQQLYPQAIGLIIFGVLIVGSSDNLVRLLLQKKMANIHPLITLFGVLLGISMFGFWGVIFGPLLLSVFMLLINMYRKDYVPESTVTLSDSADENEHKLIKIFNNFRSKFKMKKSD